MKEHWKAPQWAAWLSDKDMPVLPETKAALGELLPGAGFAPKDLAGMALSDPFYALRLLRAAESRRSRSAISRETTTALGAVMQLGTDFLSRDLRAAPETSGHPLLRACAGRAANASRIAAWWASHRADANPDEVALAALLSDIGELMLAQFAPELPEKAKAALAAGLAKRNRDAQMAACGFGFKELSMLLAERWRLPAAVRQLMNGSDLLRARLAKAAVETARHLAAPDGLAAIPDDLLAAREICPFAKFTDLAEPLGLSGDGLSYVFGVLGEGR